MTEQEFLRFIHKYQTGQLSADEQQQLDDWIEWLASPSHESLSEEEKSVLASTMFSKIEQSTVLQNQNHNNFSKRKTFPLVLKYAAVFILILSTIAGLRQWTISSSAIEWNEIHNPSPNVQKIKLSDGSMVWLKPQSLLKFPKLFSADQRIVYLQGEALFDITKKRKENSFLDRLLGQPSQSKPFTVHCGQTTTQVLGTSFNIKEAKEETEVFVLTGRVRLIGQGENEIELHPKQSGIYHHKVQSLKLVDHNDLTQSTEEKWEQKISEYTAGTDYQLVFEHSYLVEVVDHLHQKFGKKIVLNTELDSCRIRADFTDQSLEEALLMITEVLGIQYTITADVVLISGQGCQ